MSKPDASRGWAFTFCIVAISAVIFLAVLVIAPASHRGTAGTLSATSRASQPGTVTPAARGRIQASYAALPLAFEQNQGQTDSQVKYIARGDGYTLVSHGERCRFLAAFPITIASSFHGRQDFCGGSENIFWEEKWTR